MLTSTTTGRQGKREEVTMSEVRFGLIGYGAWGSHHARAIAGTAGRPRAGDRARVSPFLPVGPHEGNGRRGSSRRPALPAHRTVAPPLPPGLRRMALQDRSSRQLGPGGADPLLRHGPLVSGV